MHRTTLFGASLAVLAATAAAATARAEQVTEVYSVPIVTERVYEVTPADPYYPPATRTYYYEAPTVTYYDTTPAATTYYYEEPPIVVTAPRSEDDAITNDVVDTLAGDPRLSGNIGVDTFNNRVTLTGRVLSTTQKDIAASDARSVDGVRDVENRLRARVGEF